MTTNAALQQPIDVDPIPDVLEPLLVLPSQLASGERVHISGETRLMAAVLADAIQVFLKHRHSRTPGGQILFRETETWILSRDRRWLLSFENVCDALHINAGCLRRALHALPDATRALPVDAGRLRIARGRRVRI